MHIANSINDIPSDSYLLKDECSARNITWHYMRSGGNLTAPYTDCPNTQKFLRKHCCREGECHPSYLDEEFVRYAWANWDGLGQPYLNGGAPSRSLLCWPIFYRSLPVSLNPQGGRSHKTPLGKEAKQRLTWPLQNNNKASPLSQDDKRPSYSHHPYAAQHPPHHETGRLLPILDNNTSLSSGAQKSIQLPEQSSGRALGIGQQTSIILGSLGMVILLLGLFVVVSARYGRSRRVGRKGKGSSGAYAWAAEAEENMVIDDSMLAPERRLGF